MSGTSTGKFVASELRKDEVFLGNTNKVDNFPPQDMKHLKTLRLGEQALCINGTKKDMAHCKPVFIHSSEANAYDGIMMARMEAARR